MTRATSLIALVALNAGCVLYIPDDGPAPVTWAPVITWADAGCYWDPYYGDNIWYFEADVEDPNGWQDVTEVYADVWDTWNGEWVDSFELFPYDRTTWFSDWLEYSTWLDCRYPDYAVDIVAYDLAGNSDVRTTYPSYQ